MESKNLHNSILGVAIEYKTSIRGFSPEDEGDLKDSINNISIEDGFEIVGNSYFKFLDEGVNGKKNSVGSIFSYSDKKPPLLINWSERKGLNPYAVQNSMFNKGIKPRNILQQAIDNVRGVEERIAEGYIKDIIEEIKKENNGK